MAGVSVADNLENIRERIRRACDRAGRDFQSVKLIAVSKGQPLAKIRAAVRAGQECFGENYVQESELKLAALPKAEWHFIGGLQSNKVKMVVGRFHLIHSVDRDSVLNMISKKASELGFFQDILIELNVGGEASKGGIHLREASEFIRRARHLPGVRVNGLMSMPPPGSPESARPYFQSLRRVLQENAADGFTELSMGASQDFEVAIEEGATFVRIGTEIFGPRLN